MAELTVWRLTHKRYADSAFTGEGARRHGGRFNSPGTAAVYTSESLALALLETLTGLERYHQLRSYVFFRARLSEDVTSKVLESNLPSGWDQHPPSPLSSKSGTGGCPEKSRSRYRCRRLSYPITTTMYSIHPTRPLKRLRLGRGNPYRSTAG